MLVEAIETEFIPVLVFNNRPGDDALLLKKFNEPSWNNPVVRYIDHHGKDVIPRKDRVWSVAGTAKQMTAALKSANRKVPFYLDSLVKGASKTKTATFAMHCFWEGEARLGSLPGVVSTRSGWLNGLEVVTVKYLPDSIAYSKLVETAKTMECTSRVFAHDQKQLRDARKIVGNKAVEFPRNQRTRDAKQSDQKYYLASTALIHLPLTELQATKLNSAIKFNQRQQIQNILSPGQTKLGLQIAKLKGDAAKSISTFRYPVKPEALAAYQDKLFKTLAKVKNE